MLKTVLLILATVVSACNFQTDVEITLPPYENKLAVEAYIEPGQPIKALVTETKSFFDKLDLPEVRNAKVFVIRNGVADTFIYKPQLINNKFWNFQSTRNADTASGQSYRITVGDDIGRTIFASDVMPSEPEILSYSYEINNNDNVSMKIIMTDGPELEYYRVLYNNDSITGSPVQEYLFEDYTRKNPLTGKLEVKTPFRWGKGETCIVRVFKLSKSYYNFLNTVGNAKQINGNPFVQPTQVISNVENGFGVFAAIRFKQIKFVFN